MEDVYKNLRYGKVLFMTDQDLDGSHIKGLGINLFQAEWPTLANIPGFIGFMNTPILKARKGNKELLFYNLELYLYIYLLFFFYHLYLLYRLSLYLYLL